MFIDKFFVVAQGLMAVSAVTSVAVASVTVASVAVASMAVTAAASESTVAFEGGVNRR